MKTFPQRVVQLETNVSHSVEFSSPRGGAGGVNPCNLFQGLPGFLELPKFLTRLSIFRRKSRTRIPELKIKGKPTPPRARTQ